MNKPRYRHYCPMCIFLGQYEIYDLYWCTNIEEGQTFIRRNRIGCYYLRCDNWAILESNNKLYKDIREPYVEALRLASQQKIISKITVDNVLSGVQICTTRAYYSIINYFQDKNSVNVGVVLFCPEFDCLKAKTCETNKPITDVFQTPFDEGQLDFVRMSIQNRLKIDKQQYMTVESLEKFIATRANNMRLTKLQQTLLLNKEDFDGLLEGLFKIHVVQQVTLFDDTNHLYRNSSKILFY